MKNTIKLLALLSVLVLAFALVSCGDDGKASETKGGKESASQSESVTEQQGDGKITITFYYGVKSFDKETGEVTEYAKSKVVEYVAGQRVTAPVGAEIRTEGYRTVGWDTDEYNGKLTKSIEVHQMYLALKTYTITFKNVIGNTIKTVTVYEGNKVDEDDIPDTDGYNVYTTEQYSAYTPAVQALMQQVPGVEGYYMMTSDADKVDSYIAVPFGSFFDRWAADAGKGIGVAVKADATFTVTVESADKIVPKVEKGTIVMDGTLDVGYASMGTTYQHPISFGNKITGYNDTYLSSSSSVEGISDILNKYADFAEADAAGEGEAWKAQYDNYHALGDILGTLYACWDGDYIYFYVQVQDSTVVTQGKTYCSIANPFENDAAEIWYSIGTGYHNLCLDACGYKLWSGLSPSQYLKHVQDKGLYATKVYTDVNDNSTTVDLTTSDDPRILAEGENAGYVLEYALPAFEEPTVAITESNPLGAEVGGANWGTRLTTGAILHFSLQADTVSNVASDAALTYAVENGTQMSGLLVDFLIGKYGEENIDLNTVKAMQRWNAGWQMRTASDAKTHADKILTIVLG